jgi:hypothetical protein
LTHSESGKKIAICALTKGYFLKKNYGALIDRNKHIYENIIKKYNYDVDLIIFHEGNIKLSHQDFIKKKSGLDSLKFIDVRDSFSSQKIKYSSFCSETKLSKKFNHGYKCMCKFWFYDFIDYLKAYKFVIRVDEDCLIKSFPIDEFIEKLESKQCFYITPLIIPKDHDDVTLGLDKFCQNFFDNYKPLKAPNLKNNPYTNVFMMDIQFFVNSTLFTTFANEVLETGCIYINRWGDLPLWGAILSMYKPNIMLESRAIRYLHGSHGIMINS